jgi:hypothetical protein
MELRTTLVSLGFAAAAAWAAWPAAQAQEGPGEVPGYQRSEREVAGEVDDLLAMAWEKEGLAPRERCSDEEFARRVFLDVVGTVPTPKQVREFVSDDEPGKRARLVETLLASPGYARHAANQWGGVLVGATDATNGREYNGALFRRWLEQQFAANRPFGEIGSEMLTGEGTVYANPALNFMGKRNHDAKDLAGSVSRVFMGVQIQCAQCHDHPYENITQRDFQGMAAFFARMTLEPEEIPYEMFGPAAMRRAEKRIEKEVRKLMENGQTEEQARRTAERRKPKSKSVGDIAGDVRLPRRYRKRLEKQLGELTKTTPKFLHGDEYEDRDGETRRQALARWVFDPRNPNTARALANRYWGWLLGRGIVHPVDDFTSVNIASVPEALDVLARDVAAHHFDVRRLVRVITRTQAYQLSTAGGERTPQQVEFFAAGPLKPLPPQVLFDSMQVALGVADNGNGMSGLDGGGLSSMDMGRGGAAMMMAEGERDRGKRVLRGAAKSFFQTFDDDEGGESESFEGTIPQGLFLMNSQVVNGLLTNPRVSVIPKVLDHFENRRDRIRHLFLRTLSREPTRTELLRFETFVKKHRESVPTARDARTLSREPTRTELLRFETFVKKHRESVPTARDADADADESPPDRKARRRKFRRRNPEAAQAQRYADVLWTLISSSEFATNH